MINHSLRVFAFYALTQVLGCISAVSNRTIDDDKGDSVTGLLPSYSPPKSWNRNGDCHTCSVEPPDPNRAVEHTWHDTTWQPDVDASSVNITFTGTAIYLFGIVPNTIPNGIGSDYMKVNLSFTLDGKPYFGYTHEPDNSSSVLYNVSLFSATGLLNESHTLVASTASTPSIFLFDYALYT
ncbi:hypothetical protein B0H19DRAFT_922787 [Mycena capillaripes]|nr:hypothetical protein B0H19DRAFT_922787 [Mycena capillaripes]